MKHRITPENITSLKPNEVFVFGSNADGLHCGGAAKYALNNFGAVMGQSYGLQGRSFGIDTMSGIHKLMLHTSAFLNYAKHNPGKTFLLTEIGCGIAGYSVEEIAPLFKFAIDIENIHLPGKFWEVLKKDN